LPDYDYTAGISAVDTPAGITIDDPDRILGRHDESNPFYAAGKTATLTILSEPPNSPSGWEDLEVLKKNYESKEGTNDEWFARFWYCLNKGACEEYEQSGENGPAGGFNKFMFDYFRKHPAQS